RELLVVGRRADDDAAADRHVVERVAHRRHGLALGGGLVAAPEPAGRGEGGALRHAGVALAEAGLPAAALALRALLGAPRHLHGAYSPRRCPGPASSNLRRRARRPGA